MVATESLLALSDRPTAIFCYNDMTALGVLRAFCMRDGINVPEDISVVGFDDLFDRVLHRSAAYHRATAHAAHGVTCDGKSCCN